MDLYQGHNQSFYQRNSQIIKEVIIILFMLGLLISYKTIPRVQALIDKPLDFAVAGISLGYGKISTYVYIKTGRDFGLVARPPDPEFLFRVRVASYVNAIRPAPLFDIATDGRLSHADREYAVRALLKFDTISDWIQPFLNELSRGGLVGLYDDEAPALDELMERVRAEGGIRQPLVRDYADSVLSFMLQHPRPVLRRHAFRWVNDLLAEDAVFLIADRIPFEDDPETQATVQSALWNVRAISDRPAAVRQLIPLYARPPWKELRTPLAYVLVRAGYTRAGAHVQVASRSEEWSHDKRILMAMANEGRQFPRAIAVSDQFERDLAGKIEAREAQVRNAVSRHLQGEREEVRRQEELAMLDARAVEARIQEEAREKRRLEAERKREQQLAQQKAAEDRKIARLPATPAQTKPIVAATPRPTAEEIIADEPVPELTPDPTPEPTPVPTPETKPLMDAGVKETLEKPRVRPDEISRVAQVPLTRADPLKRETVFPDVEVVSVDKTPKDLPRSAPKTQSMIDQLGSVPEAESRAPKLEPLASVERKIPDQAREKPVVVASLPTEKEIQNEIARRQAEAAKTRRGQMVAVENLFAVKNQDVPLYSDPGYTKLTGVILPIGTKGRTTFKVTIGDDVWFQVRANRDSGWVNGDLLELYEIPFVSTPIPTPVAASKPLAERKPTITPAEESTYFEAAYDQVPAFKDTADTSDQVGSLEEGVAYLATKSARVGSNRWFYLEIRSNEYGWVRGVDLQLASTILPPPNYDEEIISESHTDKFVVAMEEGVPIYSRPSIAGRRLRTIAPGESFKIVEVDEMSENEWFKIMLPNKRQGWVQAMFVTIKSPAAKKSSAN